MSVFKKWYQRIGVVWNTLIILFGVLIALIMGFFSGLAYPFWLLGLTLAWWFVVEYRTSSSWEEKANYFFVSYGIASIVMMCGAYYYDEDLLWMGTGVFDSLDTLKQTLLGYPIRIVHVICMFLAVPAMLKGLFNDVREAFTSI